MPTIEQARYWYDEKDPVHSFDHVLRVLRLAEGLGRELGADLEILHAAALLHDASGTFPDEEVRGQHERASAEFARKVLTEEGWEPTRVEAVLHYIQAHRFRSTEKPATLEAKILFDANKLHVNGAFGVARTIGYAMQAGQPIFAKPSLSFLEHGEVEPGEPHSAYHEYLYKLRHVRDRMYTEPARCLADTHHHLLTAFSEQLKTEAERRAS